MGNLSIALARLVAIAVLALAPVAPLWAFDEVDEALRDADSAFAVDLADLAAWCREQKLDDYAARSASWHLTRSTDRFIVFDVPNEDVAADGEWQSRFSKLRRERATALFSLAHDAARARRKALAYELLWETLREDPNHADARQLLGHEKVAAIWGGPFAAKQLRAGRMWHAKFGWVAKADASRWEAGERRVGDRWLTAEQDVRRHADMRTPWQIETEHYVVTTNHSREEGVRLAGDLERLHRAWRQAFVEYWLADGEFDRMFGLVKPIGPQSTPIAKTNKHRVVYYRDRDDYVRALTASQPQIAMSLGVYLDAGRAAHFFAGPDQHPATVFHEATHQLFKETKPTAKQPGREHGMWLIEAAACYMESLRHRDGYDTLGERDAGRFAAAAEKIGESFYVPLADLAALSSDDLQRSTEIAKLYSQSAGLMTFFFHAESGRYRAPVVQALDAIYAGKATPRTLAEACQRPYAQLDADYIEFVRRAK